MIDCKTESHCIHPDDTTNTCPRPECGAVVKPFWPERTHPAAGLEPMVSVPQPIEGLRASIEDLQSNVQGCGAISDYSENSLEIVIRAASKFLALTETKKEG